MTNEGARTSAAPRTPTDRWNDPLGYYTNLFVVLLKAVFSEDEEYHWREASADSAIAITDKEPVQEEDVKRTPHLIVLRGPAVFGKAFIDQRAGPGPVESKGEHEVAPPVTTRTHATLVSIPMSVACVSGVGRESQYISGLVANAINHYKRELMRGSGITALDSIRLSEIQPAGRLVVGSEGSKMRQVLVTAPIHTSLWWKSEALGRAEGGVLAKFKELQVSYGFYDENEWRHDGSTPAKNMRKHQLATTKLRDHGG